jgi:hypothetical protein
VRASLASIAEADGIVVVNAMMQARENPVVRPVDAKKLMRRPRALRAKAGPVTVPDVPNSHDISDNSTSEATPHTEIQWLLLKLGSDLGLDIWVARNDRNRSFAGNKFSAISRLREQLPLQFDDATNRTIALIDVLWLAGNAIVAAFEIESTTSIYSGLLRMADLITMQPNLSIPLYIVAPDERRDKVIAEVNRPIFARLTPPLRDTCRYISFSSLKEKMTEIAAFSQYLKPEFLEEIAESCDTDEEE